MQQRTTQYLHPTKTGYKLVTRTIGKRTKRTAKKRKIGLIERLFAPWLLLFTMSITAGGFIYRDMNTAQVVQAKEVVEMVQDAEAGLLESSPTPTPTPEIKWKTGHATAYSCGGLVTEEEIRMNCPSLFSGKPRTANGTEPIADKTMACDKANMGRTFFIEGLGERVCTDTGGAIKGAGRFDIYTETVSEAWKFGRQEVRYYEVTK